MACALILGGTRYFGKHLVRLLLDAGITVTIGTRGQTPDDFGTAVERLTLDRENAASLVAAVADKRYDFVFDQICYTSNDAEAACLAFEGRVRRYIHTSTQSVYIDNGVQQERDFNPATLPLKAGTRADFSYQEGKRQAEAVFYQRAQFPVAAARIPIILGMDDYTGRLKFHIDRVKSGQPLVIPNLEAETSFLSAEEAARFLFWLGTERREARPFNACSRGHMTMAQIVAVIEKAVGKKANIQASGADADHTPFTDQYSRCMDQTEAATLGFPFSHVRDWLPALITQMAAKP